MAICLTWVFDIQCEASVQVCQLSPSISSYWISGRRLEPPQKSQCSCHWLEKDFARPNEANKVSLDMRDGHDGWQRWVTRLVLGAKNGQMGCRVMQTRTMANQGCDIIMRDTCCSLGTWDKGNVAVDKVD